MQGDDFQKQVDSDLAEALKQIELRMAELINSGLDPGAVAGAALHAGVEVGFRVCGRSFGDVSVATVAHFSPEGPSRN